MTAAEYSSMENQAMTALQHLRETGISGDNIGILMSREVYDMARLGDNSAYAVSVENLRSVYWGYDIYVIAESSPPIFSPVLIRFPEDCDPNQFDTGTFLVYESDDGTLRVYSKSTQEQALFYETEFTAYQAHQTERVTFADRIRAGQEREWRQRWRNHDAYVPLYDWIPTGFDYYTPSEVPPPDDLSRTINSSAMEEIRQYIEATLSGSQKKKTPPKKDWDERITPEDTKELDEFLNSLARKGTLESAT